MLRFAHARKGMMPGREGEGRWIFGMSSSGEDPTAEALAAAATAARMVPLVR